MFSIRLINRYILQRRSHLAMSTFVSQVNPVTGQMDWVVQDENYDYHQEVARSAYADMLHDYERNQMYDAALQDAVKIMHKKGKQARVLDIGTGTGLLSMMAVRCGADKVTACEAFEPMANCAAQIITRNGMADKIEIVRKRSTSIQVGPGMDMSERANILVTEVFDTELIGEGAIGTFSHAHKCLLEEDCIVVPSAANMYVQLVHSPHVKKWNTYQPFHSNHVSIDPPPEIASCPGAVALHDLQLDQLSEDKFQRITKPLKVFRFDYSGKSKIEFSGKNIVEANSEINGSCDAVFMWWDLEMDTQGKILLSCAPRWAHPTPRNMQWRDHWMQAIFYPSTQHQATRGEAMLIHCNHDEYSLWFDVGSLSSTLTPSVSPPICECGAHIANSRSRISMINDNARNQQFIDILSNVVTKESVIITLSDSTVLPLIAAQLGASRVFAIESNHIACKVISRFVDHNQLSDKVTVIGKKSEDVTAADLSNLVPTMIIAEPFFYSSALPWHNLHFWYAAVDLASRLCPDKSPALYPCSASIKAIGVNFDHLWKIRAPVDKCEGLDLSIFDKLIEDASDISDSLLEPQPLWEYPGKPMTNVVEMLALNINHNLSELSTISQNGHTELNTPGVVNGVAVWVEYNFGDTQTMTSGLLCSPQVDKPLKWEQNIQQGVHILKHPVTIACPSSTSPSSLHYNINFKPKTGEIEFKFDIHS